MFIVVALYYGIDYYFEIIRNIGYFGLSSVLMFPLGILYAYKRDSIENYLCAHKIVALIVASILIITAGILLLIRKNDWIPESLVGILNTYITLSFAIGIVLLLHFVNINCSLTRFLGKYSFEIYVLQGVGFILASSSWFHISNLYIQLVISILITSVLCVPFHLLFERIKLIFRKEKKQI